MMALSDPFIFVWTELMPQQFVLFQFAHFRWKKMRMPFWLDKVGCSLSTELMIKVIRSNSAEASCKKKCSEKFLEINRKIPTSESLLSWSCRPVNWLKKRSRFQWILRKFLRTSFLYNTSGGCYSAFQNKLKSLEWFLPSPYYSQPMKSQDS